ncbi:MAG: DNA topoisomerase VI, partial [Hadesarchaea archaeon]|nr:DNA topoisomerase VI [Hadesarchaea archaeon]
MTKKVRAREEAHKWKANEKLTGLGKDVIEDILHTRPPKLKIPSRSTTNIIYDKTNRYFVLGPRHG